MKKLILTATHRLAPHKKLPLGVSNLRLLFGPIASLIFNNNTFKKTLIVLFCSVSFLISNAQIVNIPDPIFKAVLVNDSGINTNSDSEIQVSEAIAYTGILNVGSLGIADLTGIEAFTTIDWLFCANNLLTSLNVSANTSLVSLDCQYNQLTSLNLSSNTALSYLDCNGNQLASLDVSANSFLDYLTCNGNQLTSLNVSFNTLLDLLSCAGNLLTGLNVQNGYNINFSSFNASNNPGLTCIQVDNAVYSDTAANWYKDSGSNYSTDCAAGINEQKNETDAYTIFPNPCNGIFNIQIEAGSSSQYKVEIDNAFGEMVYQQTTPQTTNIDLSSQPKGIYFVKLVSEQGTVTKKLIIQ